MEMTEPYIPGFLAFREVGFLLDRLEEVRQNHPQFTPQVQCVHLHDHHGFWCASTLFIKLLYMQYELIMPFVHVIPYSVKFSRHLYFVD